MIKSFVAIDFLEEAIMRFEVNILLVSAIKAVEVGKTQNLDLGSVNHTTVAEVQSLLRNSGAEGVYNISVRDYGTPGIIIVQRTA